METKRILHIFERRNYYEQEQNEGVSEEQLEQRGYRWNSCSDGGGCVGYVQKIPEEN